ncbi:PROTEIN WHAT'S THIS FACTOR 1-like protein CHLOROPLASTIC [Salix purpurea]|uniref:PROTEIN WHAT'S THIS FACTOR 1-like protein CHLOROPLASTIC n=1 Tax=Salix purpurea TaxID=77065 RepID=A0A9Q0PDU4_SALPP|nr:PROTEIN WHAT'S THIS FACTOR 1-like protein CHLOROPLASTIC [Salix purpurea]
MAKCRYQTILIETLTVTAAGAAPGHGQSTINQPASQLHSRLEMKRVAFYMYLGFRRGNSPAVFEIVEEGVYSLQFRLTPEAERLYLEELKVRNEMEDLLVLKLRKLLMMSMEKRILLEKIAHLRTDFGLPFEFRDTICHRYPQYFRVVATGRGPALELTHWDPELAVSAAELSEEESRAKRAARERFDN